MKRKLTIDPTEWMGDLRICALDHIAELVLFKLRMIAIGSGGWLRVGQRDCTATFVADLCRLDEGVVARILNDLCGLELLERDGESGAYFDPEIRQASELSATRSRVAKAGGGNPKLRGSTISGDLFKQNTGDVISFEKSVASRNYNRSPDKKKKEPKKKNINNIYISGSKSAEDYYFQQGCIRLAKRDYQAWRAKFPEFSEDELDAELVARGKWLDTQDATAHRNWFISTERHLRNRHAAKVQRLGGVA